MFRCTGLDKSKTAAGKKRGELMKSGERDRNGKKQNTVTEKRGKGGDLSLQEK